MATPEDDDSDSAEPATQRSVFSYASFRSGAEIVEETIEGFAGESEAPQVEIGPEEDVFSYMMFIGPTESIKSEGKVNADTWVGFFLVALTLVIQGYLLWAVFNSVVTSNIDWENGIVGANGGGGSHGWTLAAEVKGCNSGKSLCTLEDMGNGEMHYSCAPPSVRLTGRWHDLDLNGDGVWTKEEVKEARKSLQCKYIVDPMEFFEVVSQFVINREHIIWVHPDIRAGKAIAQPYFTYAAGDIIMCGYRNEKMCANVLQNGFFDAALEYNTVPRIGNTIESAMKYCRELLEPGGVCERVLPSTYAVWKVESDQECKEKIYAKFVYKHPKTGNKKSFLAVDYEAREQYQKTQTPLFKVYKTIIVIVWCMSMVYEVKKMCDLISFLYNFPSAKMAQEDGKPPIEMDEDTEAYTINGITNQHRAIQITVTAIRCCMILILWVVGTSLLLQSPEYMSLLFDAVSLKFIIELQEIFYTQILRARVKDQVANVVPVAVDALGSRTINQHPGIKDFCWLGFVMLCAICMMHYHYKLSVTPLGEAIDCTCLGMGPKCIEARNFSYDFWHDYWRYKTPQVFKDVDVLREREVMGGYLQVSEESSFIQVNATLGSVANPSVGNILRNPGRGLHRMIARHHNLAAA